MSRSDVSRRRPNPDRSGRPDRTALLPNGPSLGWRAACFSVPLIAATIGGFYVPDFDPQSEVVALASIATTSLLIFMLIVARSSARRRRKASLLTDLLLGLVISFVAIGGLVVTQNLAAHDPPVHDSGLGAKNDSEVLESHAAAIPKASEPAPGKPISPTDSATSARADSAPKRPITTNIASSTGTTVPTARSLRPGTRMVCQPTSERTIAVRVEESSLRYLENLTPLDFAVRSAKGSAIPFTLTEHPKRMIAKAASVVFLLDESVRYSERSMTHNHVTNLVRSVSYADYKVVSQGSRINILTPWTQNLYQIAEAAKRSPHSHGLTLSTAISISAEELAKRSGKRVLVLFSDGIEFIATKAATDLGRQLVRQDVQLIVVRTHTGQNSKAFIDQLVRATNGLKFTVHESQHVTSSIRQATTETRPPYYSITLENSQTMWPITVTLGAGDTALTETVAPETKLVSR